MINNQIQNNIIQKINCDFDKIQKGNPCLNQLLKELFLMIMNKLDISDQRHLRSISQSFNKNFIKLIKHIPSYINFKDSETIKKYLDSSNNRSEAIRIINNIYEANRRSIANPLYGMAFPMDSEILAYAMQLSKNEIVMEIAAASGENAALLSFSGAKKVYVNDIQPLEMKMFRILRDKLPTDIQKKLVDIEGSCLDILKQKPELKNTLSLVLCRNLIHFFSKEKQTQFFNDVKTLLKTGGRAIFTVNSIYALEKQKIFDELPNSTSFNIVQCLVTDYNQSTMPAHQIYFEINAEKNATDEMLASVKNYLLLERHAKTNSKWKVNNDQFKILDKELQKRISLAYQQCKSIISPIELGIVRVQTNTIQIYSKANLRALFIKHGFEVESTFVVSNNGHLVLNNADLFDHGQQLGIIVKKP